MRLESGRKAGIGATVGFQFLPSENVRAGVTVRSGGTAAFTAPARFSYLPFSTGNARQDSLIRSQLPVDQNARTAIRFPWMVLAGIERQLGPRVRVELDVDWTRWRAFDTVAIDYVKDPRFSVKEPQDFHDALAVRAGTEIACSPAWTLRAGAYFDATPQPARTMSPILSDTNRIGLSGGLGYSRGRLRLDAYVLAVIFRERGTEQSSVDHFEGAYRPRALTLGASVGWVR